MIKRDRSPFPLILIVSLFFCFNSEPTRRKVVIIFTSSPLTAILYMQHWNIAWCFVQSVARLQRLYCIHVKSFFMTDFKLPNLAQNIQNCLNIILVIWFYCYLFLQSFAYLFGFADIFEAPIIEQSSCDRWGTIVKLVSVQTKGK